MKLFFVLITILLFASISFGSDTGVKIVSIKGDVNVRYGLDEKWHPAATGMILKDIDTILSGENAEVILKTSDEKTFNLGSNSILDIADLRRVQERELFLYLMSKKVDKIEIPKNKTRLRVANVSVVHGALKKGSDSTEVDTSNVYWFLMEKNGALALQIQKYYTNSIIKLHKLLDKYGSQVNQAELYFYIAKGFEAIDKNGQAIDAYEKSLNLFKEKNENPPKDKIDEIREHIQKLKK
ncbi:MAG: hypothetical protein D8M58_14410 [Calditrichaeota bacterium]|nr:MAG: hypothetical protein DWQ03_15650 [Calditrichota bacterium]MBL1206594.1 hypothetical protein [Calditrichota bacterium]NOG46421.1 hypothetical protein [Calditrichota bacterium]